MNVKVATLGSF